LLIVPALLALRVILPLPFLPSPFLPLAFLSLPLLPLPVLLVPFSLVLSVARNSDGEQQAENGGASDDNSLHSDTSMTQLP
jgi:hypothetical protein